MVVQHSLVRISLHKNVTTVVLSNNAQMLHTENLYGFGVYNLWSTLVQESLKASITAKCCGFSSAVHQGFNK